MGASQSAPNKSEQVSTSHRGNKPVSEKKSHVTSPESQCSIMSTNDPYDDANPIERARKRARKDSDVIESSNGQDKSNPFCNSVHTTVLSPPFTCDVFVSGVSCRLPESNNLEEFWDNLVEGRDMVTEDDRRWTPGLHDLPQRNGKLKNISCFDAEFFRINPTQAHTMDPQLRLLFEVTYEAITDAGYNPHELKGTQTGVFVGNMFMEAMEATSNDNKSRHIGYGLTGTCDSMLSNYLSFFFDFKGPSLTVNTACSASLTAFDLAAKSLLSGQCEFAIAAGTNLLLKPGTALHMLRLGMLAKDGSCKAFDISADGYVRSEGIIAVVLTIKENARRAYAQVLNSMSSCDGHKVEGIAYPSSEAQRELIWGVHYEVGLVPNDMFYIEAHGTGTQAGDYEECKALDEAIARAKCREKNEQFQKLKDEQDWSKGDVVEKEVFSLLIGSVKSNMGHCEAASGLAGLVKVILSYQHGLIPPNLHYKSPNPRIPSLLEARLSVVTTPTPIPPNSHIGINSFGFGGAITHVILKGCERSSNVSGSGDIKSKGPVPEVIMDDVTMMIPLVSRTEHGLQQLMDFVSNCCSDKEALTLLTRSFGHAPPNTHPHRGYVLWNKDDLVTESVTLPPQTDISKKQVWFVFDGMGSQWSGIGKDLLMYDIFSDTIRKCYEALPPDVNNLIFSNQSEMAEDTNLVVDEIAAVCAVGIGLVELLKAVGIEPDGLIGHSLGELILCYADGALSLEDCMQLAYWRIKCVTEADIPKGAMATVGLPWEEVKARCPTNVWPVCNNAPQNVSIAGEVNAVERFVVELTREKIFTKAVKCSGLPYHSPLMQPAVNEKTFKTLRGIVKNPQPKSKKWVVTALPLDEDPESVICSADFHIRSLVTPVHFYEGLQKIPPGSVVIEVGAHALLQAILKRSMCSSLTIVALQDWKQKDQSVVFMRALGTCHNAGIQVNPLNVVKQVNLPVSPRTPSIGHLVSWEHIEEWHVPKPEDFILHSSIPTPVSELYISKTINIDPLTSMLFDELSLSDYKLDGSICIPPSFFMISVWRVLAKNKGLALSDLPVTLTDVTFSRLVAIENDSPIDLMVTLSTISGHFEVILNSSQLITSGTITSTCAQDDDQRSANYTTSTFSSEGMGSPREDHFSKYPQDDIYKELSLRGYQLGSSFKVLHELYMDSLGLQCCLHGNVSLTSTAGYSREAMLLCLMDSLFQLTLLQSCERMNVAGCCNVIKGFRGLTIDPSLILACTSPLTKLSIASNYVSEPLSHTAWMDGISLEEAKYFKQPRGTLNPEPRIEKYSFHPYFKGSSKGEEKLDAQSSLEIMMETAFENISSKDVTLLQILDNSADIDSKLSDMVCQIIKGCSVKSIEYDLLIVGSQLKQAHLEQKVAGHVMYAESIGHKSLERIYDVIITSSHSSIQPLLDHNKIVRGGFVLAALKPTELEEDELTQDLPTCKVLNPKLVAKRPFGLAMESHSASDTTVNLSNYQSLKLYHCIDASLLSKESTSIIHVSTASGNFSWISKLKKLLTAKDGPNRIYCVSELQREYPTGLMGMMNCLRLEGYANRLRCVQLNDLKWEELLSDHTHLWEHIKEADMIMNVVMEDKIGSYCRTPLSTVHQSEDITNSVSQLSLDVNEFACCPEKTYIITGGLGGFGLEIAEWLVERGAEYIVLTSRTGTLTPYQKRKLQILDAKGVKDCKISTLDVSDEDQAFELVNTAIHLSSKGIGGVFHLAAVLRDCLFENQNAKRFKSVLAPKSRGALNIDKALRKLSALDAEVSPLYVVFSSASAGLGNAGQTNYAFANSSMERLCEMRHLEGLHSVAIQWGAIGEVGILHTIMGGRDIESLAGTKPQPIHSCLSCLDTILSKSLECATISCYIPALQTLVGKRPLKGSSGPGSVAVSSKQDIKLGICQILGIRDPTRLSLDSKLNELGLDSLMNFEVRSLLERDFGVVVASSDLQNMSMRDVIKATSQPEAKMESDLSAVIKATSQPEAKMESDLTTVIKMTIQPEAKMESGLPAVHVSIAGEVTGFTQTERVEGVSSATSLSTQSSFVNVVGQNDE